MSTTTWKLVPDSLRALKHEGRNVNPETQAVLDGKTIFVSLNGKSASDVSSSWHSRISNASKRAMGCRTVQTEYEGELGLLVWAVERPRLEAQL